MSDNYFTPLRCTAEIPVSPFDAVVCGALADLIAQEGARCDSCAAEFGYTPLEEPDYQKAGSL